MGEKTVYIVCGLAFVSALLQVVGLCLPLHTVSWFTLHFIRIFRMKTYALSVAVDEDSNDFCRIIERSSPGWCDGLYDSHDLQDIAQRFCSPVLSTLFPSACIGLSRAFVSGMSLVIVVFANLVVVSISCYLFYAYIHGSRKAKHRRLAQILFAVATLLYFIVLIVYAVLVISQLDDMQPQGGPFIGMALSANRGTGISSGFFTLAAGVMVQIIALIVSKYSASGDELTDDMLEDMKFQKDLAQELEKNMYGATGAAYAPPPQAAPAYAPGPQSFNAPQASSAFGLPPANSQGYSAW